MKDESGRKRSSVREVEVYPGFFRVRLAKKKVMRRIPASRIIRPLGMQLPREEPPLDVWAAG
jgi:hypothetical protein